jgi:hypothetical protein
LDWEHLVSSLDSAGNNKGAAKKKKPKLTPNKERQISLRLSSRGARRLSKLTEQKEWTVTQVVEEALKLFAIHEGIVIQDKQESHSDVPD